MGTKRTELHVRTGEAEPGFEVPQGFGPMIHPRAGWRSLSSEDWQWIEPSSLRKLAIDASCSAGVACALSVWDSDVLNLVLAGRGEVLSEVRIDGPRSVPPIAKLAAWKGAQPELDVRKLRQLLARKDVGMEEKLPELAGLFGWGGYPPPPPRVRSFTEPVEGPPRLSSPPERFTLSVGVPSARQLFGRNEGGPHQGAVLRLGGSAIEQGALEVLAVDGLPPDGRVRGKRELEVALPGHRWKSARLRRCEPAVQPDSLEASEDPIELSLLAHRPGEYRLRATLSGPGELSHEVPLAASPAARLEASQRYGRQGQARSLSGVMVLSGKEGELSSAAAHFASAWAELMPPRTKRHLVIDGKLDEGPGARGSKKQRFEDVSTFVAWLTTAGALAITTRKPGAKPGNTPDAGVSFQWGTRAAAGTRALHVGYWCETWGLGAAQLEQLATDARSRIDRCFDEAGGLQACLGLWAFRPRWPLEQTPFEREQGWDPAIATIEELAGRPRGITPEGLWLSQSFSEKVRAMRAALPSVQWVERPAGAWCAVATPAEIDGLERALSPGG